MISRAALKSRLLYIWLWIVDLWEFVVLLTLGFHPARSILSLQRGTKEACELITTCLEVYRKSVVGSPLSQIKDLLSSCNSLSMAEVSTDDGYNLLQLAVQKSDIQFVEYLLRDKKVNPNLSKCSLPLHIALNIGSVRMVELLLDHKARLGQRSGMCHPEPHVPVYSSHSKFFFVSPSVVCGGVAKDAYQRVIDKDNVELLDLFLRRKSCSRLNVLLLHYACNVSATRCIRLLVDEWDADVNAADNRGCNAVMHSLHSSMDTIHYLVSKGADVSAVSYQSQNVLHKLYCNTGEPVSHILEKTKLFLALGADTQVLNKYDVFRNTALHYLCAKYASYGEMNHELELRLCIGLLLNHNADTAMVDCDDYPPLLRILQCSCLSSLDGHKDVAAHTHRSTNSDRADRIYDILKLFSQADPTATQGVINREKETAMFYVLRMCFDYEDLSYIRSILLLKDSGANINHVAVTQLPGNTKPPRSTDVCVRSLISVIRDRARLELMMASKEDTADGDVPAREVDEEANSCGGSLVVAALEALFKAGLDPNARQIECRTRAQAENVNALACFSRLIQETHTSAQLQLIREWIRVILQWGGNPQLQAYRPEPQICTSQGSIFLKQVIALPLTECFADSAAQHWSVHPEVIREIVMLLAGSMSQNSLHQTISTSTGVTLLSHVLSSSASKHAENTSFVQSLTSQPRTLKDSARFQIYKSLGRRIFAERVQSLPIPSTLKTRISEIC